MACCFIYLYHQCHQVFEQSILYYSWGDLFSSTCLQGDLFMKITCSCNGPTVTCQILYSQNISACMLHNRVLYLYVSCLQKEPEYAECLVSKLLLIDELPPVLIFHMKRFLLGIPVRKNNLHIDFPDSLNMAPYCTESCEVSCHTFFKTTQHYILMECGSTWRFAPFSKDIYDVLVALVLVK